MSKLETNTIDNISGSSTLTIGDSNTSTIALKSGATLTNFPANTPAFYAYKDANTTISDATYTTVVCNVENLDTNNGYDTSTGKYTIPTAGKYYVSSILFGKADGNGRANRLIGRIIRERSGVSDLYIGYGDIDYRDNAGRGAVLNMTTCHEFNVGDIIYPDLYVDVTTGTPSILGTTGYYYTSFGAYKIIT